MNKFQRQYPRFIQVDLGVGNIGAGNEVTARVPQGAQVVFAGLQGVDAFNNVGTGVVTATISDGTTNYVNAQDVKTTGAKTVANLGKFYPQGGEISFSLAETVVGGTAATDGRAVGYVGYLQLDVGDEVYG